MSVEAHEFTVVLRGHSAAIFPEQKGAGLVIGDFPFGERRLAIAFATRYIKRPDDIVVPGNLWVEVKGSAVDFNSSITGFANAALSIIPILGVATNAAISPPEIELAFDSTPGLTEREYFQSLVPPEGNSLRDTRIFHTNATLSLIAALARAPESSRLHRACSQYQLALDNWRTGHDGLAAAHLWMALEALTKSKIRDELLRLGLKSDAELATHLGVEKKALDAIVRRRILLNGDDECYENGKRASDAFEHGFGAYEEINKKGAAIRSRLATHVRNAILDLTKLPAADKEVLTSAPFDTPMGNWPLVQYLRGKLIGERADLAAPGSAYPFMRWTTTIKSSMRRPDGLRDVTPEYTFTAELAEGIGFQQTSFEIWRAT